MGDLIFRRDRTGEAETRPRGTHMRMGNRNHRKTVRAREREADGRREGAGMVGTTGPALETWMERHLGTRTLPQMLSRAKLVNNRRGRKQFGEQKGALGWRPSVRWKS